MIIYPKGIGEKPISELEWLPRKVRLLMIGGSHECFIYNHHHAAFSSLNVCKLVGGAPSRSVEKADAWGKVLDPDNTEQLSVYSDWREMLEEELQIGKTDQADAVVICTETEFHAEMIIESLTAGFHVIVDKPMVVTLSEAISVKRVAEETGKQVIVTFNHNCYPATIAGQEMVSRGGIGQPHSGRCYFDQDWGVDDPKIKQAWRFNGERCCITDIGTHAERLACFWLGRKLIGVEGRKQTLYPGRIGDDHVLALLTYEGDVQVELRATEMYPGHSDQIGIALYGNKGAIAWDHTQIDILNVFVDGERKLLESGRNFDNPARRNPPGHPHGFNDGWHAAYRGALGKIIVAQELLAEEDLPEALKVPVAGLGEGIQSVAFVEAFWQSCLQDGKLVNPQNLIS